jgi:hypothetical protein
MNKDLSPRARAAGAFIWCSFLTACIATMVLFAFFEPERLWRGDRLTTYALGFFFLWSVAGSSAALTLYMARTER